MSNIAQSSKKCIVSLYSYLSIIYVALALLINSTLVLLLNYYTKFRYLVHEHHNYHFNLVTYLVICIIYLYIHTITSYYHINTATLFVIVPLLILTFAYLYITSFAWDFIDLNWLKDRYIHDEDYFILKNIICLSLIMIPLFLATLISSSIFHIIMIFIFFAIRLDYLDNYETTAHDAMHKKALSIRKEEDSLSQVIALKTIQFLMDYVLGLFFLYPPHLYYHHHLYNHHVENCGPGDITSPLHYQRQSVTCFCRAALKFMVGWFTTIDLLIYLFKKRHYKPAIKVLLGQIYFYLSIYLISFISPLFASGFLVFHVINGYLLAKVIWRWHAFIDPTVTEHTYNNALNITSDNPSIYFHYYHSLHHIKAGMRNSHMEIYIQKHKGEISKTKMVVLRELKTKDLITLIFAKRLDIISRYWVDQGEATLSREEIETLLQMRLEPSDPIRATNCYFQSAIDSALSRIIRQWNQKTHASLESAL